MDGGQRVAAEEVGVLVDLLSHDMLNYNQATLSYLELIQSHPGADQRTKEYAGRAALQVRTSSMLLDGIRRFVSSSRSGPLPPVPADVRDTLALITKDLSDLFPQKRVKVDTSLPPGIMVLGAQHIQDLFGNLFMNLVQLDPNDDVRIEVSGEQDNGMWRIDVTAPTAVLPAGVDDTLFLSAGPKDLSKMARVSGAVFASSIARVLGGTMRSRALDHEGNTGCAFQITLKGVAPR